MANLSEIVNIQITTLSARVTQQGFGTPLVLGCKGGAHFGAGELVRSYTSADDMVSDGFATSDPEYLAVQTIFSQNPSPDQVKVGVRTHLPTQRWAVTPVAVNNTTYSLTIDGHLVSYTSDSSATLTEIITGLKTAIDALTLSVTTSSQGSNTFLRIVANNPGDFHTLTIANRALLGLIQDHADGGIATDLAAVAIYDNDWYGLVTLFNSSAEIMAAAAWVEANEKIYLAESQDTDMVTSSTSDIGSLTKASAFDRTAVVFHPNNGAFLDAGWLGACLPLDPGSETWKFKTIAGVAVYTLTATEENFLIAKYVDYYETIGGNNMTTEGIVSSDEYIDIVRFRDWLKARIQEGIFGVIKPAKKIPYTDAGVAIVTGVIRNKLKAAVDIGGLSPDPKPTVTAPKVADVDSNDKANRILPNVSFTGTYAGAIHKVQIQGQIII